MNSSHFTKLLTLPLSLFHATWALPERYWLLSPPHSTQLIIRSHTLQKAYKNPGQPIMGQILEYLFIVRQVQELWTLLKFCFLWKVVMWVRLHLKNRLYHIYTHTGMLGRQKGCLKPPPDLGHNTSRFLSASFSCALSSIPALKCKMCLHSAYPRDFCKSLTSTIV